MKAYKCIIFDCDGTLVDSEYLCNLGLEVKLREMGIEDSASDMMIRYRGGKLGHIIESLEKKHSIALGKDFESSYREIVEKLFQKELKPVTGVTEVLEKLRIPCCVASSGPIKKINQALEITQLKRFFGENIFSSYIVGSWKPDPGLFLYAAEKMGYLPEECLVIEDSMTGIQAAVAGGFDVYAYGNAHNKERFQSLANKVFLEMSELESLLM